jgi:hypothetical protein
VRAGNTEEVTKEADFQTASMAKAIGVDQDLIAALSHVIFAISIERWPKDRISGAVWYLDCELAEGYVDGASVRESKALAGSATVIKAKTASLAKLGPHFEYPAMPDP